MDASDHRSGTQEFTSERYSTFFKINSTICTTTDMMIDQALTYIHHGAKKQRLIIFD